VLYNAMSRADYGLVELFGPWGLYKNGAALDPASNRSLWLAHQNHIHVGFTGTPEVAREIVGLPTQPSPTASVEQYVRPPVSQTTRRLLAQHAKALQPTRMIRISSRQQQPLPQVRELALVSLKPLASAAAAVPAGVGLVYGNLGTVLVALFVA